MEIRRAGREDLQDVARLVWDHAPGDRQSEQSLGAFTRDLAAWQEEHVDSHHAFLARVGDAAVGIAWVALLPRVPRPEQLKRVSADLQSVYVVPEHRGTGIGSALVAAATEHGLPQYLQREAD